MLPIYPERAKADHISGCAGFEFHIAPDGRPTDLRQLTEYPLGYGFGEATRTALLSDHFDPAHAGPLWYYWHSNFLAH